MSALPVIVLLAAASIESRLATCVPQTQREAITCLDRALTQAERETILASDYLRIPTRFPRIIEAVQTTWFAAREAGVARELRRWDFSATSYAGQIIRSYWLSKHRCPLGMRERARIAAQGREIDRRIAADSPDFWRDHAGAARQGEIIEPVTYALRVYTPRHCRLPVPTEEMP